MNLSKITPLILTYNEEPNIRRCLERLTWAVRVVVVDSGSSDQTLAICTEFPNVVVHDRKFDDHTSQWNYGIDQVADPWVLSFDADYITCSSMEAELASMEPADSVAAYQASFRYCMAGIPLRGTLYPRRALLFRKDCCRYIADGHTQLLSITGEVGRLETKIDHDDRKPLSRWLESQRKYAALEAEKMSQNSEAAGMPDQLRRLIWPAAPAAFFYTLFVKGLILDGWPGFFYVLQRTYAELLLSLELLDRKLKTKQR